jgi:radical SAM protein with 4Fe4S-binding SPASM domain
MTGMAAIKGTLRRLAGKTSLTRKGLAKYRQWRGELKVRDRGLVSKSPVRIFDLELTNKCPFRCVMCPRTNNMTREQGLMDFDTFKTIVDEYVKANPEAARTEVTWLHHFGESLTHPEFARFIRYAASQGVRAALSINPLMLTPAVARELLEANPSILHVSLDGHDDESFFQIRGVKDAYEKSKKNLLDFLKLKVEMGSKTRVYLGMIDFAMNKESIERMGAFWKSIPGIDEFTAKEFVTWNGDAKDVNRLTENAVDNAKLRKTHSAVACNVPWEKVCVTWDGVVVPCCYDYDKKYPLGDAKTQSLAEIWNGERMKRLRQEFIDNDVRNPLCRSCPLLYQTSPSGEDAAL